MSLKDNLHGGVDANKLLDRLSDKNIQPCLYGEKPYVVETQGIKSPYKVLGEIVEDLGETYSGNDSNVMRIHIGRDSHYVRITPISEELESEILDSLRVDDDSKD